VQSLEKSLILKVRYGIPFLFLFENKRNKKQKKKEKKEKRKKFEKSD